MLLPGVQIAEVIDANRWRRLYAWGLALVVDSSLAATLRAAGLTEARIAELTGELPDEVIQAHLQAALSEMGAKLGTRLETVRVTTPLAGETLPTGHARGVPRPLLVSSDSDYALSLQLPEQVLGMVRLRAVFYGDVLATWSTEEELARLQVTDPRGGIVRVGFTLEQWARYVSGWYTPWRQMDQPPPISSFWYADYLSGFVAPYTDGAPGSVPEVLDKWVATTASLTLLPLVGAANTGGAASSSISMDGLSRSVSLPDGGIWGYYLRHLKEARDGINLDALRTLYNPRRVFSLRGGRSP